MIQIETWFPIHMGHVVNPFHKEIEDELTQQCLKIKKSYKKEFEEYRDFSSSYSQGPALDWFRFQDASSYSLLEDQKFNRINNWIDDQVNEYAEQLAFYKKLKCVEGWFNIYEKYDYAGYHVHPPNVVSCVYFLNCEEETAGKLIFKNNNDAQGVFSSRAKSPITSVVSHNPTPGKLVIFSSDLEHCAQQHLTDDLRITLAYNHTTENDVEKRVKK